MHAYACAICGGHSYFNLCYDRSENTVFEVDATKLKYAPCKLAQVSTVEIYAV
jgi:hypothetical protein